MFIERLLRVFKGDTWSIKYTSCAEAKRRARMLIACSINYRPPQTHPPGQQHADMNVPNLPVVGRE